MTRSRSDFGDYYRSGPRDRDYYPGHRDYRTSRSTYNKQYETGFSLSRRGKTKDKHSSENESTIDPQTKNREEKKSKRDRKKWKKSTKSKTKSQSSCDTYKSTGPKACCHHGNISGLLKHFNPKNRTLKKRNKNSKKKDKNPKGGRFRRKKKKDDEENVVEKPADDCFCSHCIGLSDAVPDHCKAKLRSTNSATSKSTKPPPTANAKSQRGKTKGKFNISDSIDKQLDCILWSEPSDYWCPAYSRKKNLKSKERGEPNRGRSRRTTKRSSHESCHWKAKKSMSYTHIRKGRRSRESVVSYKPRRTHPSSFPTARDVTPLFRFVVNQNPLTENKRITGVQLICYLLLNISFTLGVLTITENSES